MPICGVYLLDAPYLIDKLYDYILPPALWEGEAPESLVGRVGAFPFGGGDHVSFGVIWNVRQEEASAKLKEARSLLSPVFSLSEEMRACALFLRDFTLCSVGEAVRAMIPSAALGAVEELYYDAGGAGRVCACLRESPGMTVAELEAALGAGVARALPALRRAGAIRREDRIRSGAAPKYVRLVSAALPTQQLVSLLLPEDKTLRSAGQRALLAGVLDLTECEERVLLERTGGTRAQLRSLYDKGLLTYRQTEICRNPYAAAAQTPKRVEPIVLSRAQTAAYETLHELAFSRQAKAALLYGVTGSGKTKVMMRLLDDVLAGGKTAIVMVPEIALTPQTVSLFCARYGGGVGVMHSSLSLGERFDVFRRIRAGEIRLVIGTRSAVFAPLENLGLIVMDEEHEHTYKSDQNPKYHAKDVAAFRCGREKALLLLASATPSVESFYKAETGKYTLVELRERFGGAVLPETEIVDLREELRSGNASPVSDRMLEALQETMQEGNQAILFCNRRGYNSAVSCKSCGEALMCPNCSVSLTYHTSYGGGYLLCHTCGYKIHPPKVCPSCGSDKLSYQGFGTQKAESEIERLCSGRVMRMDADTTAGKAAYDRMLEKFRAGEADILLGTQMVTKGHDFPKVTLAGVLLADASLYMTDFRAGERTFSLLTQVVGRAGRSRTPGRAVIQTFCPEHDVIRLAAKQDYDSFYRREIALRRAACFPPFCDMVRLTLSGSDEQTVLEAAGKAKLWLSERAKGGLADLPVQLYGPLEMQVYKTGGKYRLQFLLKCRLNQRIRQYVGAFLKEFPNEGGRGVTLSADINPN